MKRGATRPVVVTQTVSLRFIGLIKILLLEVSATFRMTAIAINFNGVASAFA